jgi:hypothetical protein
VNTITRLDVNEVSPSNADLNESRRTQLGILQERIVLHGSRMWQLPLTYLTAVGGSLSFLRPDSVMKAEAMFVGLLGFGAALCFCMYGAHEGYRRTIRDINKVQRLLQVDEFAKCHWTHTWPYWALLIGGMLVCLVRLLTGR